METWAGSCFQQLKGLPQEAPSLSSPWVPPHPELGVGGSSTRCPFLVPGGTTSGSDTPAASSFLCGEPTSFSEALLPGLWAGDPARRAPANRESTQ